MFPADPVAVFDDDAGLTTLSGVSPSPASACVTIRSSLRLLHKAAAEVSLSVLELADG